MVPSDPPRCSGWITQPTCHVYPQCYWKASWGTCQDNPSFSDPTGIGYNTGCINSIDHSRRRLSVPELTGQLEALRRQLNSMPQSVHTGVKLKNWRSVLGMVTSLFTALMVLFLLNCAPQLGIRRTVCALLVVCWAANSGFLTFTAPFPYVGNGFFSCWGTTPDTRPAAAALPE